MNKIHNGYINTFFSLDKFQIDKTPDSVADANMVELNGDQQQSVIVSFIFDEINVNFGFDLFSDQIFIVQSDEHVINLLQSNGEH